MELGEWVCGQIIDKLDNRGLIRGLICYHLCFEQEFGFSPHMVVPHGSYLMNCGSAETEVLKKSRDMLVDELQRCQKLGLAIFNFHPGK